MKIEDIEVVCCCSKTEPNTWYIFRENGIEVKVVLFGNRYKTDRKLMNIEIEYLNNNLI